MNPDVITLAGPLVFTQKETMLSSGSSHARYDHRSRPRVLHVVCPKCSQQAEAAKESELEMGHVIGDLAGTWELLDWTIKCHHCPYRLNAAAYSELPQPYYRVTVRGFELWAWNRDHFDMLLRLLNRESITNHPYAWFATYAHRDWLRDRNRSAFVKQMKRFLVEQTAS